MTAIARVLFAGACGIALYGAAAAQSGEPPAVLPLASEPPARLTVFPPAPQALARGVIILQFRTEHLRTMPVFGQKAAEVSPHIGHLHVTVDAGPATWAHTSEDPVIVVGLAPGPHRIRLELADPTHRILTGETVEVTVPDTRAAGPAEQKDGVIMPTTSMVQVEPGIELRRMVLRPARPAGTVLFLHGFPETMNAWKDVAGMLAADFEVHAFDWPGYGQSSRPAPGQFSYSPRDYARVLREYVRAAGIDRSRLLIYATDIGALPALLAALEQPDIAREIVVGDFAPFDRPQYMAENLRALKSGPSAELVHAAMNKNRDEILHNAHRRGLPAGAQFELPPDYRRDMEAGWDGRPLTPADAFYHYYSHFTRDQDYFEANMARLKVPVKVVWGEQDFYIDKAMGMELARRAGLPLQILPGLGHYPHLQDPARTAGEVRAAFRQLP